jgi:hypothetical protein
MNLKLHIIKREDVDDYSQSKRFCFAVINLSRSKNYPVNFVCMLPMQPRNDKKQSCFEKVFREKSVEQAKMLLTGALKTVNDSEVTVEIERRLKLLDPKQTIQVKCGVCGKMFPPRRIKRFKNNFCEECMKKKFENRD